MMKIVKKFWQNIHKEDDLQKAREILSETRSNTEQHHTELADRMIKVVSISKGLEQALERRQITNNNHIPGAKKIRL